MGFVSVFALILLVFLCSASAIDATNRAKAWSGCECHKDCPSSCKLKKIVFSGSYSKTCFCNCNCNTDKNPTPDVPATPPPPPPAVVQNPPPSRSSGGSNTGGCLGLTISYARCITQAANLLVGSDLDADCCDVFSKFVRSCAGGLSIVIPPPIREYCQQH